jgi:dephospho-CoA kinase
MTAAGDKAPGRGQLSTGSRETGSDLRVFGLTGGIASGKSTVAKFLGEAGLPVIDADWIARELSEPGGAAHTPIVERFGTGDRAKLREIVFKDAKSRRDLEAILHPLIRMESLHRMRREADAWRMRHPGAPGPVPMIYEATLLVETGRYKDFDGLIVVEAPRDVRKIRVVERDGSLPELAEKIISAQLSDEERRAHATHVIENAGTLEELHAKVLALLPRLTG